MLDFKFFQMLAEYANANWKCNFTDSELHDSAMELFQAFTRAKRRGKLSEDSELHGTIQNLIEDVHNGNEDGRILLNQILSEFEVI